MLDGSCHASVFRPVGRGGPGVGQPRYDLYLGGQHPGPPPGGRCLDSMIYVAVIAGAILFVPLMLFMLVDDLTELPEGARYSRGENSLLWAGGLGAAVVAVVLFAHHGDGWWLIPVVCFVPALLGTKSVAIARRDREREEERRQLAEREKRLHERRKRVKQRQRRERERVERLGKDGLKKLVQMKEAVKRIGETEAAREGWLGDTRDVSFGADLQLAEDQLEQIVTLRTKAGKSKRLPHATEADKQMVKEAEAAAKRLETVVRERIRVIEGCARKAEEVDDTLREQRHRADAASQRDELRGQLAAMLAGVELTRGSQPSDSADAVVARVEAFHELKDSINPGAFPPDGAFDDAGSDSSWLSGMGRLWPW